MNVFHTFDTIDTLPIALTIGNFDGVHLGHQAMLRSLVEQTDYIPSVMTFSPHPKCVFGACKNFLITDSEKKIELIKASGVARCWALPFEKALQTLTPLAFIDKLKAINVKSLTVGEDFKFGHKGAGNIAQLRAHFDVTTLPTQYDKAGNRISSSLVRECLHQGDFVTAKSLLGRAFSYSGEVIHGQKLGRTINFPTANIAITDERLMPSGVFAVKVNIEGISYSGIANCGRRPTVGHDQPRLLESYIFDYNGDLYGKFITVTPLKKIRNEQKFSSLDNLKNQIQADIYATKDFFSSLVT